MTLIKRHRPIGIPALMDELFSNEFLQNAAKENSIPAVNIKEVDKGFELELAAPGFAKEDINLEIKENTLTISSKQEEKKEETNKEGNYTRKEFNFRSFSRAFNLPKSVDQEHINAKYENGVLRVDIPKKAEEAKLVKQIEIA